MVKLQFWRGGGCIPPPRESAHALDGSTTFKQMEPKAADLNMVDQPKLYVLLRQDPQDQLKLFCFEDGKWAEQKLTSMSLPHDLHQVNVHVKDKRILPVGRWLETKSGKDAVLSLDPSTGLSDDKSLSDLSPAVAGDGTVWLIENSLFVQDPWHVVVKPKNTSRAQPMVHRSKLFAMRRRGIGKSPSSAILQSAQLAPMKAGRHSHSLVSRGDHNHANGGRVPSRQGNNQTIMSLSVERYNVATNAWEQIASMNICCGVRSVWRGTTRCAFWEATMAAHFKRWNALIKASGVWWTCWSCLSMLVGANVRLWFES